MVVLLPAVMVGWQVPQLPFCGCGDGGGAPWQEPQRVCVPSTRVHCGVVALPPRSGLPPPPWQYVLLQV